MYSIIHSSCWIVLRVLTNPCRYVTVTKIKTQDNSITSKTCFVHFIVKLSSHLQLWTTIDLLFALVVLLYRLFHINGVIIIQPLSLDSFI